MWAVFAGSWQRHTHTPLEPGVLKLGRPQYIQVTIKIFLYFEKMIDIFQIMSLFIYLKVCVFQWLEIGISMNSRPNHLDELMCYF